MCIGRRSLLWMRQWSWGSLEILCWGIVLIACCLSIEPLPLLKVLVLSLEKLDAEAKAPVTGL